MPARPIHFDFLSDPVVMLLLVISHAAPCPPPCMRMATPMLPCIIPPPCMHVAPPCSYGPRQSERKFGFSETGRLQCDVRLSSFAAQGMNKLQQVWGEGICTASFAAYR